MSKVCVMQVGSVLRMEDNALSLALQQQPQMEEEPLFEILPPSPDSPDSQDAQYSKPPVFRSFVEAYSSCRHDAQLHVRRDNLRVCAGLRNMGNTCFLNAVLQCLTHTPPLVHYLKNSEHTCANEEFCAFCALREHVNLALSSSGEVIEPSKLVDNLSNISASFKKWEQEDAHEYMHCLLEALHKSTLCLKSSNLSLFLQGESFVKKLFGGRLRSQIKCVDCLHCSDTFEPLIDLSLEIDKSNSITKALECFTTAETVDFDGKYKCENCEHSISVLKQLTIDRAPEVLLIQLKRFVNNGYIGEKINKDVVYSQVLDLKPFVSNAEEAKGNLKYELYAVLVHSGWSMSSGHYFSFVQTSPEVWHKLDDCQVKTVDEKTVLEQQAYVLLYFRQGSTWFSCPVEETQKQISIESPKSVLEESSISDCFDSATEREPESSVSPQNKEHENGDGIKDVLIEMLPNPKQNDDLEVDKLSSSMANNQSAPTEPLEVDKLSSTTANSQGTPISSSPLDEYVIKMVPISKQDKTLLEADKLSLPRLNSQSTPTSPRSLSEKMATTNLEKRAAMKPISPASNTKTNFDSVGNSHIKFPQQGAPNSIKKVLSSMPGNRRACFLQCIQSNTNNNFQAPKGTSSPVSRVNSSKKRNSLSEDSLGGKRQKKQQNEAEATTAGRRRVKSESPRARGKGSSRTVSPSTQGNKPIFPILPMEDDPYSFELEIEQMPKYVSKTNEVSLGSSPMKSKKTRSPNGDTHRSKQGKD